MIMSKAMTTACEKKNWKQIINLFEEGESVNAFHEGGNCPILVLAIINEWKELAHYLIEHGANVNAKSATGYTPLMAAASNADLEMVKALVKKGANISQYSKKGLNARAYYAVMYGENDCEILKILTP
jgi:ankyrin repeat protein